MQWRRRRGRQAERQGRRSWNWRWRWRWRKRDRSSKVRDKRTVGSDLLSLDRSVCFSTRITVSLFRQKSVFDNRQYVMIIWEMHTQTRTRPQCISRSSSSPMKKSGEGEREEEDLEMDVIQPYSFLSILSCVTFSSVFLLRKRRRRREEAEKKSRRFLFSFSHMRRLNKSCWDLLQYKRERASALSCVNGLCSYDETNNWWRRRERRKDDDDNITKSTSIEGKRLAQSFSSVCDPAHRSFDRAETSSSSRKEMKCVSFTSVIQTEGKVQSKKWRDAFLAKKNDIRYIPRERRRDKIIKQVVWNTARLLLLFLSLSLPRSPSSLKHRSSRSNNNNDNAVASQWKCEWRRQQHPQQKGKKNGREREREREEKENVCFSFLPLSFYPSCIHTCGGRKLTNFTDDKKLLKKQRKIKGQRENAFLSQFFSPWLIIHWKRWSNTPSVSRSVLRSFYLGKYALIQSSSVDNDTPIDMPRLSNRIDGGAKYLYFCPICCLGSFSSVRQTSRRWKELKWNEQIESISIRVQWSSWASHHEGNELSLARNFALEHTVSLVSPHSSGKRFPVSLDDFTA